MNIFDAIKKAGQTKKILQIVYKKKDGTTSSRHIEPYELRDGKLFAWDISKDDHIRQFFITGILQAEVIEDSDFTPRYPVKV